MQTKIFLPLYVGVMQLPATSSCKKEQAAFTKTDILTAGTEDDGIVGIYHNTRIRP
jgi:hypothetical protein